MESRTLHRHLERRYFFITSVGDINFNKKRFLLAVKDGEFLGFIWVVKRCYPYLERGLEPHRGYIVSQAVAEYYQRQGISTTLLNKIELQMKSDGTEEITLGAYSPNYHFLGVDKNNYSNAISFYALHEYVSKGEAVSMNQTLIGYTYPNDVLKQKKKLEIRDINF